VASGYAGGKGDIGDMFSQAGIGAAIGFGTGFAVGYSYTAGWQSVMHGYDTRAANAKAIQGQLDQVAAYARGGNMAKAKELWGQLSGKHDMLFTRTNIIPGSPGWVHPDVFASKTTGGLVGMGFDIKYPAMKPIALSGIPVEGHFRPAGTLLSKSILFLKLESANSLVVDRAVQVLGGFAGRTGTYKFPGLLSSFMGGSIYTCQEGVEEMYGEIYK